MRRTTVAEELVDIVTVVSGRIPVPRIATVFTPCTDERPDRDKFGVLMLEDGSAGFFYVLLGNTWERFRDDFDPTAMQGGDPMAYVPMLISPDEQARTLAMAAVNAISQHLFRRAGYTPPSSQSLGAMQFDPSDHVGMVGYFAPLVKRLTGQKIPLTVVELKPELVRQEGSLTVTLDARALGACNKVLCTASTLLNGTLEFILGQCRADADVAVIGPTAGCLPDPLFRRGVDRVGASRAVDAAIMMERVRSDESWGDAVEKYVIRADDYPGIDALLERLP